MESPSEPRRAIAIMAHPDDIEIYAGGTLLLLREAGWETHYMTVANGSHGTVEYDIETTRGIRAGEARNGAALLGAIFHPSLVDDLAIDHTPALVARVAAVIREVNPTVILTHSPQDYMEDHMNASRVTVTAAFAKNMPNLASDPPRSPAPGDVAIYHALPHGLRDQLRVPVRAEFYIDTASVHARKREALAAHLSQKNWLDVSQGMDSYLITLDEISNAIGKLSGRFPHAEGWRRHLHVGYSRRDTDPLGDALAHLRHVDPIYAARLEP